MALTFDKGLNTILTGVGIWSDEQKRQADALTAASAIELERLRLEQERLKLESKKTEAETTSQKIKKALPIILVSGIVIIGGIGAWFYFKKKKIS